MSDLTNLLTKLQDCYCEELSLGALCPRCSVYEFIKDLEEDRNRWKHRAETQGDRLETINDAFIKLQEENQLFQEELEESARLHGISGNREHQHLTKIRELEEDLRDERNDTTQDMQYIKQLKEALTEAIGFASCSANETIIVKWESLLK